MEAQEITVEWETRRAREQHVERRGSSEWLVQVKPVLIAISRKCRDHWNKEERCKEVNSKQDANFYGLR